MVKGQVWRGALAKYKFRCKVHGMVYRQRLNNRVDGQSGCLKCKRIARGDFTITEMESRFPNMVKGQKCRGTQVKYRFLCEIHGRYRQRYDHHYHHGCKKCADKDNASVCRSSTAEFIAKARKKHGNKYDYSQVKYVNNHTHVIIMCPKHGPFRQIPNSHLQCQACPKCGVVARADALRYTMEELYAMFPDLVSGQRVIQTVAID